MTLARVPEGEDRLTHTPKIQGHLDNEVRCGYYEEVPRRILRHGRQDCRNPEPLPP